LPQNESESFSASIKDLDHLAKAGHVEDKYILRSN